MVFTKEATASEYREGLEKSDKGWLSHCFLWYKYKEIPDKKILAQSHQLNRNAKARTTQREMSAQGDTPGQSRWLYMHGCDSRSGQPLCTALQPTRITHLYVA